MQKQTNTFPMAMYRTSAADITYKELRAAIEKSVSYAQTHFDAAKEELRAVPVAEASATLKRAAYASTNTQAAICMAKASQRLYNVLTLKRTLHRFYTVLRKLETKDGLRSDIVMRAIDFTMRGQNTPNFIAIVTMMEWGFRNRMGDYQDLPEGALTAMAELPCVSFNTLVEMDNGRRKKVGDVQVGDQLVTNDLNTPSHALGRHNVQQHSRH